MIFFTHNLSRISLKVCVSACNLANFANHSTLDKLSEAEKFETTLQICRTAVSKPSTFVSPTIPETSELQGRSG